MYSHIELFLKPFPNDNSKQNSFTYILIPPIPHFIIFTLIDSKIKQIDDIGTGV